MKKGEFKVELCNDCNGIRCSNPTSPFYGGWYGMLMLCREEPEDINENSYSFIGEQLFLEEPSLLKKEKKRLKQ